MNKLENKIQNLKVQKVIAVFAVLLFAVKIIAWYYSKSVAILTDAIESIVNILAGFLGLYSLQLAAKPRDNDHPYGHGKIEFISAAIEGTFIVLAGGMIIYESVQNLLIRQKIGQLDIGIALIIFTAIANYLLGTWCHRKGLQNNSLVLISSGKHLQTDTYSSIGIIAGLILLFFTKIWWIDSVVAIIFSLLIIFTGIKIIRSAIAGIMDEADEELLQKLVMIINSRRRINWVDLHNVRIVKYGSTLHVDCHLTLPWYFTVKAAHEEIDELSNLVRNEFGDSVELSVHSDACTTRSCAICHVPDCAERKWPYTKTVEWTSENVRINNKHTLNS